MAMSKPIAHGFFIFERHELEIAHGVLFLLAQENRTLIRLSNLTPLKIRKIGKSVQSAFYLYTEGEHACTYRKTLSVNYTH